MDAYFKDDKKVFTVCGLALHLGFISRQSFVDYKGYGKEFSDVVKKAITRIEAQHEERLGVSGKPTGSIFWLKNHGWFDKREHEHSLDKETATLLGLIDGSTKGKLPDREESEDAGE